MIKTKHTEGKWWVTEMNNVFHQTGMICSMPDTSDQAKINAKLIAQAPELLRILIVIQETAQDDGTGYISINKATLGLVKESIKKVIE